MLGPNSPRPSHAVADYQAALIDLGHDLGPFPPLTDQHPPGADGFWGDMAAAATEAFQLDQDLEPTGLGDALTVSLAHHWAAQTLVPIDPDEIATKAELTAHQSDPEAHPHDHNTGKTGPARSTQGDKT